MTCNIVVELSKWLYSLCSNSFIWLYMKSDGEEYKNLKCFLPHPSDWLKANVFTRERTYVSSPYPIQLNVRSLIPSKRGLITLFCALVAIQQLPKTNSRTTMNQLFTGQMQVSEIIRVKKRCKKETEPVCGTSTYPSTLIPSHSLPLTQYIEVLVHGL